MSGMRRGLGFTKAVSVEDIGRRNEQNHSRHKHSSHRPGNYPANRGFRYVLEDADSGELQSFEVAGYQDFESGVISSNSAFGRALDGRQQGDIVDVGGRKYVIRKKIPGGPGSLDYYHYELD